GPHTSPGARAPPPRGRPRPPPPAHPRAPPPRATDPVDERVVSHISSTAIEGGTAHPELKLLASN
ncbi:hypothetical protein, partial [Streptomyces sp. NPDC059409]|uniref:hypothetical protein n=1 Tax=Streptomyces sp. NPDC059409 TaxID=3346824 RepID=UPI0036929788